MAIEGQWLEMSADMERCATPVTNFKQFLFSVTDASKPP